MALIQLLVQLMGVGENGDHYQSVSCQPEGVALVQKSVKGNVTTQNLNTGESSVKEVEQTQKVAKNRPNAQWIASAANGRDGGLAPSPVPTVGQLLPATTKVSRLRGDSAQSQRTVEGPASSCMATLESKKGSVQRLRLVPSTVVGTNTQMNGVNATRQLEQRRRQEQ